MHRSFFLSHCHGFSIYFALILVLTRIMFCLLNDLSGAFSHFYIYKYNANIWYSN